MPSSARQYRSRPRASPRPVRRASRGSTAAPRVPAGPDIIQGGNKAALTRATQRCGKLLDRRRWRGQRRSFPRRRAAAESFNSVPTFSKKEQFPFPLGFQIHGLTVCDALPPHFHLRRPLLPTAMRLRLGDVMPLHASLACPPGDLGSSAGMCHDAMPSIPSSSAPLRCTTAGMSIVPLVPLTLSLKAWLALPNPSCWLIRTIRLGYVIRFTRRPPKFSGALETSVAVRDALVLSEEIAVLLAKDAIEPVPPAGMKQGFYWPYFNVPKEGGGLWPILDL